VNFEHSWGDGVAVLRYVNEIYDDSLSAPALDINSVDSSTSPSTPFFWSFTDEVKKGLQEAAMKIDATMSSLEFSTQLLGKKKKIPTFDFCFLYPLCSPSPFSLSSLQTSLLFH
jgi:hypothetical protein